MLFDNRIGYNRNGSVGAVWDPKTQLTGTFYDRAGRVTKTEHRHADLTLEETRTFTYDRVGNVTVATCPTGPTSYTYDDLYRVTSETRLPGGGSPVIVSSTYDLAGNRLSVLYPSLRSLVSVYDPMNRLTEVKDSGDVTYYEYDDNGNRLSCTGLRGT